MPLKLKFNKLVMVGDHEQLPATVISKKAKYFGYHKSLFGRSVVIKKLILLSLSQRVLFKSCLASV